MKKIAFIGTVGFPARYGGFETVAEQLAIRLSQNFYCSKWEHSLKHQIIPENIIRIFLPFKATGWQSIFYDAISLIHALIRAEISIVFGISAGPLMVLISKFFRKKIIVNVDGLESGREKWHFLARWYLAWSERVIVRKMPILISDNQGIYDYIIQKYHLKTELVSYGADHIPLAFENRKILEKLGLTEKTFDLTIARIEKENNLEMICDSYTKLPERKLIIIGNWGNSRFSRSLFQKYKNQFNIILVNPVYIKLT